MRVFKEAYEQFGIESQLVKTTEECSELAVGIATKKLAELSNVLEEMADVEIMIQQLKYSLGREYPTMNVDNTIDSIKSIKLLNVEVRLGIYGTEEKESN
jgi:NTP pyrophosphatase (non-canonical NTP hydrolase)